jgi:ssDNA-binding replication factor A large subunit
MGDDEEVATHRRRADDTGLAKLIVPGLVSLCLMLAGAGILGAIAMSSRITRLEAARQVSPEDVATLRAQLEALKDKGKDIHEMHDRELADVRADIERLREWMRRRSGGDFPAAMEASPASPPRP